MGYGFCSSPDCACAPVWLSTYLYCGPLQPSGGLVACGVPPWAQRRDNCVRDGMPSVRKPSLAIQEGALGDTGTPNHCPSQVCSGHCGDCQSMWAENHPFFCGRRGGCTGNPVRLCAACCLLWSMPLPSESGEGPSGWALLGVQQVGGCVCAWLVCVSPI